MTMRIVGYHTEDNVIANSDGDYLMNADDPMAYLAFLLEPKPNTIKVFWHLDYAVAKILKMIDITEDGAALLWQRGVVQDLATNHVMHYIAGKYLSIKYGKHRGNPFASFGDMHQYHKGEIDEENACNENQRTYCYKKAESAREVGTEVYQILYSLHLRPTRLTSPIRCYEQDVLLHSNLPTITDIPIGAAELASQCTGRAWMEAFRRGHFTEVYDYDINGAYPYYLSQLWDIRNGSWVNSKQQPSQAIYGFIEGMVTITANISPIMFELFTESDPKRLFTPVGSWEATISLSELRFIYEYHLGEVEIYNAWWWIPDQALDQSRPFEEMIYELDYEKEKSSGIRRDVIKRIMAGIWGKCLEYYPEKNRFGPLYNPVYGAIVETEARLQVAHFCMQAIEHGANPLHIMIDGVILDKEVPIDSNVNKLGNWRLSNSGPCIIIRADTIGMKGKEIEEGNFALNYDKLLDILSENPDDMLCEMSKLGFISLGNALEVSGWDKLGEVGQHHYSFDLEYNLSRYTIGSPKTCADILGNQYDTQPWPVHLLEGMPI